jgi:thymidylate kinase
MRHLSTIIAVSPPDRPVLLPVDPSPPPETRSLVERLGEALSGERVAYLQWKGNWKRSRWMSGEGDIDLLVDRSAEPRYSAVMWSLGFRRADPPPESAIAGIESFFGLDPATGRLIHVHTHYRLVVGGIWRTVYRLPIEEPLLASARPGAVFPVAAPEYELIAFAARMVQRYNALDTVLRRQPRWLKGIQAELNSLVAKASRAKMADILAKYLPTFDVPFIDLCLASLSPHYSRWRRMLVHRELHRRLLPHARRPPIALTLSRIETRLLSLGGRIKLFRKRGKYFAHGGTVIALLGGDGAGKSTCTRELAGWLSDEFNLMTAHLGRPPRSLITLAIGAAFRVARLLRLATDADEARERAPEYLAALRDVCTARDRFRLYLKARRFALAGGLALCERYPVPQNPTLSGPRLDGLAPLTRTRFGRWLVAKEAAYYRQILTPDVLILLRVDPETAVRRKTDEPAEYVRARCQLVWDTDWTGSRVHIVDASRPLADVLAALKTILWELL